MERQLAPETTFCSEISGPIPIELQEHWDWLAFDIVRYKILKRTGDSGIETGAFL